MNLKKIINRLSLKYLLLTNLLVVFIVIFLRIYLVAKIIPGNDIYFNFSIIKEIFNNAIPINLDFSLISIPYIFNIYDLMIAGLMSILAFEDIIFLLGSLFAVSIPILLYSILVKLDIKRNLSVLSCLIFVLSPVFISLILSPTKHIFGFVIFLLLVRLIFNRSKLIYLFELLLLVLLAFIGLYHLIAMFILLTLVMVFKSSLKNKKKNNLKSKNNIKSKVTSLDSSFEGTYNFKPKLNKFLSLNSKKIFFFLAILVLICGLYYVPIIYKFGAVDYTTFSRTSLGNSFFSDFQESSFGFGAFSIILFIIGFVISWKYKKMLWPVYILMVSLFIMSVFESYMMIYLNIFVSIFVMLAIFNLINYRWTLTQLKNITIYLVFLGLLFSFISYMDFFITTKPDSEIKASLDWLSSNTVDDGIIFSHYKYSNWITFYSGRQVMFNYYNDPDENFEIFNETENIFSLRNIVTADEMFNKYNISHIWIHREMKEGLVWNKDDEGLLFLLTNNETFSKVYESKNIEIYKII